MNDDQHPNRLYVIVLAALAVEVILFYIFTRTLA